MPVLLKISHKKDFDYLYDLYFYCEGCKMHHGIINRVVNESRLTKDDLDIYIENGRPHWNFNGDFEKPTFMPSIHVKSFYDEKSHTLCHSLIIDGKIQYLPDCRHDLKGKTINLPHIDKNLQSTINLLNNQKPKIMKKPTWQEHVKNTKKENPKLKHSEALKVASKTYKEFDAPEEVSKGEITKAKGTKKPKLPKGKTGDKPSYTAHEDGLKITKFEMVLELEPSRQEDKRVYIYDIGDAFIELPENTTTQPDDLEGIKTLHKPLWNKQLIIEEYGNNGYSLMYGSA